MTIHREGEHITIPLRLFEFREWEIHHRRWLIQNIRSTVTACVQLKKDPIDAVNKLITEFENKLIEARKMTAEQLRKDR